MAQQPALVAAVAVAAASLAVPWMEIFGTKTCPVLLEKAGFTPEWFIPLSKTPAAGGQR